MIRCRVLHAIHDFLPRHCAGSEIYAFELARELSRRHDVFILCAEYDPAAPHGALRWRTEGGLTIIELINNWEFDSFEETYSSPRINAQLVHVLEATRPEVLHVHNLLNLSFDLPRLARERGIVSVATLHDYTLVCASGGQRVHTAESHVCEIIDPARCSRCFAASPSHLQMTAGGITGHSPGRRLNAAAAAVGRRFPQMAAAVSRHMSRPDVNAGDIVRRLAYARHVFDTVDLFISPSAALAAEFVRLGLDPARIEVSDYGFVKPQRVERRSLQPPLRIGFVGTLVWHKGVHLLLEAARQLSGEFEVQVFGDATVFPAYSASLRRMAEGLPVRFMGRFERADIARVYGAFDVLVVPSLWPENSPLVIHEAFMHGVPVVGARQGGIPELVTDGVNGLVCDAFSADALAVTLQKLIDDPLLVGRLGSAAPPVKGIEEDGRQWERRYENVLRKGVCAKGSDPFCGMVFAPR